MNEQRGVDQLPPLPDHVRAGLDVMFVGINPGVRSARVGHHYAGHSNRFWRVLFDAGLIPHPVSYHDDWRLPEWGLGLTNLVERVTATSSELTTDDYAQGRRRLLQRIRTYRPRVVALLGITIFRVLASAHSSDRDGTSRSTVSVGLQDETCEGAGLVVLPNPSGRNARYSYADLVTAFRALADVVHAR